MKNKYEHIALIIPAYEPDEKLHKLLDGLSAKGIDKILILDDGSGDKYAQLFDEAKDHIECKIYKHIVNLGKGRALKDAFNYCLNIWPDICGVVTADSDGQHTPEDICKVMDELVIHNDKLILGVREFGGEDVPQRSKFGNNMTSLVFKLLMGIKVSDTQTGLRGIPTEFMKRLMSVSGERYEFETNMLLETKTADIDILEVPIKTVYIEQNEASHFRPLRDSIRIYALFFKYILSSGASSIIDLAFFTLFCTWFRNANMAVSYIFISTALARVISATCNYFINLRVVFASGTSIKNSVWRYALLALFTLCASAILVNLIYPFFGGLETFVKLPVDILLFFINYVVQREFVYKKK